MVVVEGRWPHSWLCKQLGNLAWTCPKRTVNGKATEETEIRPAEKPAKNKSEGCTGVIKKGHKAYLTEATPESHRKEQIETTKKERMGWGSKRRSGVSLLQERPGGYGSRLPPKTKKEKRTYLSVSYPKQKKGTCYLADFPHIQEEKAASSEGSVTKCEVRDVLKQVRPQQVTGTRWPALRIVLEDVAYVYTFSDGCVQTLVCPESHTW